MALQDIKKHLENAEHGWSIEDIDQGLVITSRHEVVSHLVMTKDQMLIESLLFPVAEIADQADFDNAIMFSQKGLPLTTVGKTLVDGKAYYCAFGALSSHSKLDNVELELVMLYQNIDELLLFANDFLRVNK